MGDFFRDFFTSVFLDGLELNDAPRFAEPPPPEEDSPVVAALRQRINDREKLRWELAGQAADEVLARASRRTAA